MARHFAKHALENFQGKSSNAYASALDLDGLISLDLVQPRSALSRFQDALSIRSKLLASDDPLIAFSLNNVALAFTEMGDEYLGQALEAHDAAIQIRLAHAPDRVGNSYSNLASLQLRMNLPDTAEKTLAMCPSLKDFTDDTFLKTGNPRFSGDMVLLSRIRAAQGREDEALRLASRALTFRRQLLGLGLKTCDSMYDVAQLLNREGKSASADEILQELINTAEALPEGDSQLARALWRLADLKDDLGRQKEAETLRERAFIVRNGITHNEVAGNKVDDERFQALCPWMLW